MYSRCLLTWKGFWNKRDLHVRCGGRIYLLLLLITSGQVAPAYAQKEPRRAYEAVFAGGKAGNTTLLYDQGKYSIQFGDTLLVCDNARPPARWFVDLKKRTVQLGFPFVVVQVIALIKKEGLDATAKRLQVDRSLLARFARYYKSYVPRNLDHTLQIVAPSDAGFLALYERAGTENVAGYRCNLYRSHANPECTLWVEPSSGYVLRELYISASNNPRIPPVRSERGVSHFRILNSVEPTHLQIPAGFTVFLPRILADLALPAGVKRQLMTGAIGNLGFDIKQLVQQAEQQDQQMHHVRKAPKR